jgi:hypothetical protein
MQKYVPNAATTDHSAIAEADRIPPALAGCRSAVVMP